VQNGGKLREVFVRRGVDGEMVQGFSFDFYAGGKCPVSN
jgi:hypothetical protein